MYDKYSIGRKIFEIRQAAGKNGKIMKQEEFSLMLCKYMRRPEPYSPAVISSWEIGRRRPSEEALKAISELWNIPYDELCGNTPVKTGKLIYDQRINQKSYKYYLGKPVWVTYKDMSKVAHFAILAWSNKKNAYFLRSVYSDEMLVDNIELYSNAFDYAACERRGRYNPLGLTSIMKHKKTDLLYVSVMSDDLEVRSEYNGWYHLSENRRFLESDSGHIFSITKLNVAYKVYNECVD